MSNETVPQFDARDVITNEPVAVRKVTFNTQNARYTLIIEDILQKRKNRRSVRRLRGKLSRISKKQFTTHLRYGMKKAARDILKDWLTAVK